MTIRKDDLSMTFTVVYSPTATEEHTTAWAME
jgi:hypothetical protein